MSNIGSDIKSIAPDSVFKRISARTLDRVNKVQLMYSRPCDVKPTGFVDASFKEKEQWLVGPQEDNRSGLTRAQVKATKTKLDLMNEQIIAEKAKRLEVEAELRDLKSNVGK